MYFSPNIQTSLAVVKRLKLMDSGAIHLIGNRESDAAQKKRNGKRKKRDFMCLLCDFFAKCVTIGMHAGG